MPITYRIIVIFGIKSESINWLSCGGLLIIGFKKNNQAKIAESFSADQWPIGRSDPSDSTLKRQLASMQVRTTLWMGFSFLHCNSKILRRYKLWQLGCWFGCFQLLRSENNERIDPERFCSLAVCKTCIVPHQLSSSADRTFWRAVLSDAPKWKRTH